MASDEGVGVKLADLIGSKEEHVFETLRKISFARCIALESVVV
jgi:hypothetical protein